METTISSKSKRDIKRKLAVLNYVKETLWLSTVTGAYYF
jgi:hypothetical protein